MKGKVVPIAALVILVVSCLCLSIGLCQVQRTTGDQDLSGVWQLRFEPPVMKEVELGGFLSGTKPPSQPNYEFIPAIVLRKISGRMADRLLGTIYWDEGDMSFSLLTYPTLANGQLRLPISGEMELVGKSSGKDTFVGQVFLMPGQKPPICMGPCKDAYQRRFTLSRISTKVPPKGERP